MTDLREEMAQIAREAFVEAIVQRPDKGVGEVIADALLPTIKRVRAEERERCAKVAESRRGVLEGIFGARLKKTKSVALRQWLTLLFREPNEIAAAIRALT